MESNITSDPIWLAHISNYSIQLVFTGTADGTLKLQASNDEGANDNHIESAVITNWTDILNSDQAITAAGGHIWTVENAGYRWVRVVWTDGNSSGANITSARMNVKGI